MDSKFLELAYKTKRYFDVIDFTDKAKEFVKKSEIKNGLLHIQLLHTSCALIFNENEPLLLKDIEKTLNSQAPLDAKYNHDNLEIRTVNVCDNECRNGHSHCKAIRLLPFITICIKNGELVLGQWQRTMLVELDSSRDRKILMQIIS
ncbi:MAG TPA: secondary thiamine-phosphate synthase enzyme YjbQ [Candidatus Pacearchaeota archaeon]|nr:secondary thiamine-phosphate synthase enzyme YjbQ [Candidatus Pacearchaeota archaeon]HOU45989.1 secondary thiamine-phosphate synthase enzyme YjbQ [Candidatus Pacearchaeota archaeon]HPM08730.1 secondary thiamine-phosphate synthase enzyme YjbQ [Candidatus Pacearchaeota archaeon]HQI74831.1 secondary thiamine-phosphate synthase enzyme YjbQ [Candidatus Pacearchaeota archaeon]